jgi:hypothetical protein
MRIIDSLLETIATCGLSPAASKCSQMSLLTLKTSGTNKTTPTSQESGGQQSLTDGRKVVSKEDSPRF